MFLVCTRCGKRVSPGVLVGPDADRIAVNPTGSGGELVTANSLAK
jgi:hypothetical protein